MFYTGLCPHPPAQRKTTTLVEYGIRAVQRKAEFSRQNIYKCSYRQERKENLCIRGQCISQKESAISKKELKAGNDLSIIKPCLEVQYAPEAKQAAQDANRTRIKTERNLEALERKVSENKMEGMVLTEPEEEEEEEMYRLLTDLSSSIMWENINFVDEMHEEKKLIKSEKSKKKKMQEKAARSKEEVQNMALIIERKQEELKKLNYLMRRCAKSDAISRKTNVRECCEKMADVYLEIFDRFCSPDFPLEILSDLNDWSLDLLENTRPQTLRKLLKQILKDYAMCVSLQKQAEAEALREERRQKRLERALSPPVKIIGKKLMPRSRPPKVIKKEEPVETKNQE